MTQFFCRICGLDQQLDVWTKENQGGICACCGTMLGLDDRNKRSVHFRRMQWLTYGSNWFKEELRPNPWTIKEMTEQLKNVPEEWW